MLGGVLFSFIVIFDTLYNLFKGGNYIMKIDCIDLVSLKIPISLNHKVSNFIFNILFRTINTFKNLIAIDLVILGSIVVRK